MYLYGFCAAERKEENMMLQPSFADGDYRLLRFLLKCSTHFTFFTYASNL